MAVEVVCEICGSGSTPHLISKCVQCNGYQHRYCMQVVAYASPREWHCSECQDSKVNRDAELSREVPVASQEHSSMTDCGNQKKLSWSKSVTKEETQLLEAEAPVPDTSGDEELARKLFVEINRDHLGIPGDGALVIVDDSNDNVPAKTEAQQAAEEGVAGSPVDCSGNGNGGNKASDATQDTDASAASNDSL